MHKVYLLVGGNLDNTCSKYEQLFSLLAKHIGTIAAKSQFYKSPPWGYISSNPFVNMAIGIDTHLDPATLIKETQKIESFFGRKKKKKNQYEDRAMDIDIIFYDTISIDMEDLQIPHPRMHLRNFVLTPLNEICPSFIHPILKKNVAALQKECIDNAVITSARLLE